MKKLIRHTLITISIVLACYSSISLAMDIAATGSWSETIDESDLIAGAGTNLTAIYTSANNTVIIDITDANGIEWAVDKKKVDTNWHSNLVLRVRRNNDGTGVGGDSYINGGVDFTQHEVTDTDTLFYNGKNNRTNVGLQLRFTDVSLAIPPDSYSTTVYFTIYEQ